MKDLLIIIIIFSLAIFGLPAITGFMLSSGIIAASDKISKVQFPETINIYLEEKGEIKTVTGKEYIIGCLCAQIPINYELEALKAQAAASATYALRTIIELKGKDKLPIGADISDSKQLCQSYYTEEQCKEQYGIDLEKFRYNLELAADYGISHIITYDDEPIYAVYHSVSAGATCPAQYVWGTDIPYLKRTSSEADKNYINFECVNQIKTEEARRMLMEYDPEIEIPVDPAKWFTDMQVNEEGYVISVNIGKNKFNGGDIWRIFGLRSVSFTVSYSSEIFTFITKGFGHGCGLSQYGANELTKKGYTADQIINYYYRLNDV